MKPSSKGFEVVELPKSSRKANNTIASAIQINTPYNESSGYGNTTIRDELGEKPEMDVPIPHKEKELQMERNLIAELLMVCIVLGLKDKIYVIKNVAGVLFATIYLQCIL